MDIMYFITILAWVGAVWYTFMTFLIIAWGISYDRDKLQRLEGQTGAERNALHPMVISRISSIGG